MRTLKVATVCSGIGAPEKALKNLDIKYELSYFCEFDKFAIKSYCAIHNEPETKNLGDLTKVEIEKLPIDLDLIVGGTSCQDFSLAGKRAGGTIGSDTRSSLMWNFVEIIAETKPKVVLWENVPGCLIGKMRTNFNKFISALSGNGYKVYSEILNAKNFGIPQNRERVFVVAIKKDLEIEFEMPKGYDCGIRLKNILEKEVDKRYFLSEKAIAGMLTTKYTQSSYDVVVQKGGGFCGTLCAGDYKAPKCINTNQLIELTQGQSQGNRVYDPNGVSVTLNANGGGMGAKTGLYWLSNKNFNINKIFDLPTSFEQSGRIYDSNGLSPTIMSNSHNGGYTPIKIAKFNNSLNIRKLTPKECFRLMGFSDIDFNKCLEMSDTQLYKQAGNSIVVNVLMAILGQLYNINWKPIVYGKWWKTEEERMEEIPLFQLLKEAK